MLVNNNMWLYIYYIINNNNDHHNNDVSNIRYTECEAKLSVAVSYNTGGTWSI